MRSFRHSTAFCLVCELCFVLRICPESHRHITLSYASLAASPNKYGQNSIQLTSVCFVQIYVLYWQDMANRLHKIQFENTTLYLHDNIGSYYCLECTRRASTEVNSHFYRYHLPLFHSFINIGTFSHLIYEVLARPPQDTIQGLLYRWLKAFIFFSFYTQLHKIHSTFFIMAYDFISRSSCYALITWMTIFVRSLW